MCVSVDDFLQVRTGCLPTTSFTTHFSVFFRREMLIVEVGFIAWFVRLYPMRTIAVKDATVNPFSFSVENGRRMAQHPGAQRVAKDQPAPHQWPRRGNGHGAMALEYFGAMGIPWYPCFPLEKWGSQGLKKKSFSTTWWINLGNGQIFLCRNDGFAMLFLFFLFVGSCQ